MVNMVFQLADFKDIYFRSYMKMQDLFALVGGFANFIKIGVSLLLNNYNENNYFSFLNDEFFCLKGVTDPFKQIQSFSMANSTLKLIHTSIRHIHNEQPKKVNKVRLTRMEKLIGYKVCKTINKAKRRNAIMFFEQVEKTLKGKLDVVSIIRTQFDFAKLRFFLFNNKENYVFNLLREIRLDSDKEFYKFLLDPYLLNNDINVNDDLNNKMREVLEEYS